MQTIADVVKRKSDAAALLGNKRAKISIYDEPPNGHISLEEFESFALDRMRILKAIDSAKAKGVKQDELNGIIEEQCRRYLPIRTDDNFFEDRRKDNISHYILRIAYSRTEDLRKWFLRQEEVLFRHRFAKLDSEGRMHIMGVLNARNGRCRTLFVRSRWRLRIPNAGEETAISTISSEEYIELKADLDTLFGNIMVDDNNGGALFKNLQQAWQHVYKVPFEEVTDLVSQRKVILQEGFAYVLSRDIVSVVVSNFRLRLSRQLTENARAFYSKAEEESERLGPLLENLTNAYLGADFSSGPVVGRITLDKIPAAVGRSAPLCMRALFDKLRSAHHLKHDARMQFGLFLKGIGVTLEDSLAFWREELVRGGKTSEQFDKQYAYNIRHNYGMEGKRVNYTPYSCARIIGSTPVGDQFHGCPFRHWDEAHLASALQSMRLGSAVVHDVMDKVRGHHYQVACLKVFEATHPGSTVDALNHPNQYFQDSLKHHEAKAGAEGASPEGAKPAEVAASEAGGSS